ADRENEGDLMVAADRVTDDSINFMLQYGKGLICLSLTKQRLEELQIPLQVTDNQAPLGTNFTVSIDHSSVVGRGVTASGRAKTILKCAAGGAAGDFVMPGFVFPLCADEGGVLRRVGQTEGSVDLARLAGCEPAGVICEVMAADGQMLSGDELQQFCDEHALKITSVKAIAEYRLRHEVKLRRVAEAPLEGIPSLFSSNVDTSVRAIVYEDEADDTEQIAFVVGEPKNDCLVRIHSECLTGDVFTSERCDCGPQFDEAFAQILRAGQGVLVYLHQEGRGIGLGNKLKAYQLQDEGLDTVDANLELGFDVDLRDYRAGAQILLDLGLNSVALLTNNPEKVCSLENFGVRVSKRLQLAPAAGDRSQKYIQTKKDRLGHWL
ncbi:MAG: GTP cyclohydrolase II, partial [Bdellovibrionales bacterium]|nr:GTP cyclohydrolase II [Bdellovibrionales bacterium]